MLYQLISHKLIPVIKIDKLEDALPIAGALCDAGLPVCEITLRSDCAISAIELISKNYPNMLLGAGTVLNSEMAKKAISAGAKFIVSPGIDIELIKYCQSINTTIVPGAITPTEITTAINLGIEYIKFFPAELSGGLKMIKALSAPFNQVKFIPTGGIDESNIINYLSFDRVVACGGSFMISNSILKEKNFSEISNIVRKVLEKI